MKILEFEELYFAHGKRMKDFQLLLGYINGNNLLRL